jgi:hypothetical protein
MSIESQDQLISSLSNGKTSRYDWNKITGGAAYTAGRWYDMSMLAGIPIANTFAGTALNAQVPTEASGFGIYHGGNTLTEIKSVLNVGAVSAVATAVPATLMLVDMCLYYPSINMNVATAQTLVNTSTLTRYTTGAGLRAYLVTQTTTGATAHNIAISYTNQAGTAGRALPVTVAGTASAITPHITHSGVAANNYGPFLPLASGDTGVRSVQSLTLSAASGAGTAALVLCKPITTIPITTAGVFAERDLVNQLPSLPVIQDGACLVWLYFAGAATAASTNIYGNIQTVWG